MPNDEVQSEVIEGELPEQVGQENVIQLDQEQYADIIENQELLLNELQELGKVLEKGDKADTVHTEQIVNAITTKTENDYTEVLGQMVESQNTFSENITGLADTFALIDTASSSVITYAVVFVPLILIVSMLWWFFRQFLRR